jgi:hypothetical protein
MNDAGKVEGSLERTRLLRDGEYGLIHPCGCRAMKRVYIGQKRPGGTWVQCSKPARPAKKTCYWHRQLED